MPRTPRPGTITVLEGYPLQCFMELLTGSRNLPGSLYRLRIRQTVDGGAEFKVNDGVWTGSMGHSDLRQQFGTATHEALEAAERDRRHADDLNQAVDLLHTNPWDHGLDTDSGYADRLRGDSKGGFH